ncbi:hypothetical protein [Sphaerospermopsis torques-reginae]|uniref:Uncharacterized protein n=1 Tax=Sphaerospermopsis torques-reginae ITEP-024 TaxID=984208 RepID=A0ABX8WZR3_9CYAN|nr:hypothetical protein [Sphaerospermopsis torques-reginae]QYX31880.1 hypothetical protein K2F26_00015 [Sphaerospermopsis torques-reginae ITEP-024]
MKTKISVTLTIIAAVFGVNSTVYAQSTEQVNQENFTLKGDSLVDINDRRAENDFSRFFNQQNNQGAENNTSEELPLSESITIPDAPIFLQPANQNLNENDGLQLQFDLRDSNSN